MNTLRLIERIDEMCRMSQTLDLSKEEDYIAWIRQVFELRGEIFLWETEQKNRLNQVLIEAQQRRNIHLCVMT